MPAPLTPEVSKLLDALASGSTALLQRRFWSHGVNQLMAALGEASGVSRVWIFQMLERSSHGILQDYVFEWASRPEYRQLTQRRFRFFTTIIDDSEYADMVARRQRGGAHTCIVSQLSPGSLRDNLESQQIRSMVTVPIMVNGKWWGTLGFDDCEREVNWLGPGLQALVVAAELIASTIYRHQLTSHKRQVALLERVAGCGAWEIDPGTHATWCSSVLLKSLGYPDDYASLRLRRLLAHVLPDDRADLRCLLRLGLTCGQSNCRIDVRLKTLQGDVLWYELVMEAHYAPDGRLTGLAGLAIDISQRKQSEVQASVAAEMDELTGVLNRRGMFRHLTHLFEHSHAGQHFLLLLDIDYFKLINDRYGHPAGDALLVNLTKRLQAELRPDDCLVRLGGEEFAVIAADLSKAQALALGERLRCSIADDVFLLEAMPEILGTLSRRNVRVPMTISLGITELSAPDLCAGQQAAPMQERIRYCQSMAVAQADQALYAAKEAGRNQVMAYWQWVSVPESD
ncbi:diguanylate cyclase domain-containing protein [Halomonas sp. LS-001]